MKLFGFNINKAQNVKDAIEGTIENNPINSKLIKQQLYRSRQDIKKWRDAITIAESPYDPNRVQLYECYQDVVLDAHLTSLITTRKNKTLNKPFKIIAKNGEENLELTNTLKKEWFLKFMDLALDSIYYGYSLIQFDQLENKDFKSIDLVPRPNVKPELQTVSLTYYNTVGSIKYLEEPYSNWCIGVGEVKDLGLLLKASPLVLWKKNVLGAWSEYAELFGMPFRMGKTNVRNDAVRTNMEKMLQNMGSAAWGVFDTDDVVEFIESSKSTTASVYEQFAKLANEELSKLILGQTGTSDAKSYVGAANVHAGIAEEYIKKDMVWMEYIVNGKLLPFLNNLGFNFKGYEFKFDYAENIGIEAQFKIDSELLKYYNISEEYILKKYGTPVQEKKAVGVVSDKGISEKLKNLYNTNV